jgi:hypothetical protein
MLPVGAVKAITDSMALYAMAASSATPVGSDAASATTRMEPFDAIPST